MADLGKDKKVLLMLCTRLALPEGGKPFTAKEFSGFIEDIGGGVEKLGEFVGAAAAKIQKELRVSADMASRLSALLSGDRLIDGEVERLESMRIWTLARGEEDYPSRYVERLGKTAPRVLFGSGDVSILERRGMAVVGSRNVDERGNEFAQFLGSAGAKCGLALCSGAARGVDQASMRAALEGGGKVAGVLADSLVGAIRQPETRELLEDDRLVLITPYSPDAPFSVGTAMGRNRLIYCLADYGVVVASDAEKGGTWAGAVEALKEGWLPVFIGDYQAAPAGNRRLIGMGGIPIPNPFGDEPSSLSSWLDSKAGNRSTRPGQQELFQRQGRNRTRP
ncbi:MAG: DNA-processing protein DprA [Elusimicrobia bacterium]|nr:DNA-processing protein DprA [Elusimicrobiota bacterium]